MPRVHHVKNSRKEWACGSCGKVIKPGDAYIHWSFRYGGRRIRCTEHPPRPSDLTQSKLSEAYAAQEQIQDALGNFEQGYTGDGESREPFGLEELKAELDDAADQVRGVADEYRDSIESMNEVAEGNPVAEECEEKAEALEEYAEAIERASDDMEGEDRDSFDEADEYVEAVAQHGHDVVDELSV